MKLIGTKDFYRQTLGIAVPITIQVGITNFVGMLDNIMVGRIGTDAMSGVAIINQLNFVFMLCLFGGSAGIGIFTAQFAGKGDMEGVRYTLRMKLVLSVLLTALGIAVFHAFGTDLISLWLRGESGTGNVAATLSSAKEYLFVMYFGMLPFALSFPYSGTLRENSETVIPMVAGISAVVVNLAGNYLLIYGKLGLPALGVTGAALATVISRYVEFGIVAFWTHMHPLRYPFAVGLYRSIYVPVGLVRNVIPKAVPLLLNEFLWSLGQTVNSQQYSLRGLDVVAAMNISSTVSNVFNIVFIAMGDTIAIMLGRELGKKQKSNAEMKEEAHQLALLTTFFCLISGTLMFAISGRFPMIYNTSGPVRHLATWLIRLGALFMPLYAYENSSYFTIRSGGKTWITFAFDSLYTWTIPIPLLMILVRFTDMSLLPLFACVQCTSLIKCIIGFLMVHSGFWINDLTKYTKKREREKTT